VVFKDTDISAQSKLSQFSLNLPVLIFSLHFFLAALKAHYECAWYCEAPRTAVYSAAMIRFECRVNVCVIFKEFHYNVERAAPLGSLKDLT
jgi:hypothetical protein